MGCWFSRAAAEKKPPPYDFYRCSPLRYMGYAGHIGSACGLFLPCSVTYVPQMAATAYICADVFNKTLASAEKGEKEKRVVIEAFDALLWQILASLVIPGLVFGGIRRTTQQMFVQKSKGGTCKPIAYPKSPLMAKLLPCLLALLATPLIIRPIDRGVDYILDSTYRTWTAPAPEDSMSAKELEREAKRRAEKAEKEAKEKLRQKEREAQEKIKQQEREAQEKAKALAKAEKEALEKLKQQEKEAKERAKQKCKEEEKAWKEKKAAEERALAERIKKEEAELKEKQAKLAKEMQDKFKSSKDCD